MKMVTSKTEFGEVVVKAEADAAAKNNGARPVLDTLADSVTEVFSAPAEVVWENDATFETVVPVTEVMASLIWALLDASVPVATTSPVFAPPTVAEVVVATAKTPVAPETWVIFQVRFPALKAAFVTPVFSCA